MKKLCLQLAAASLFLALSSVSHAAVVNGTVFCDANQDGTIDAGDPGISGVLVIITNQNSTFSNSAVTTIDGSFSITIPDFSTNAEIHDPLSQVYVETLDPESLPSGSSIEIPTAITNITETPAYFITFTNQTNLVFTSGTGNSSTGDWLINDPECGSAGNCKLSGHGQASVGSPGVRVVNHSFGGTILSGTLPSGSWTDLAPQSRLAFKSTSIQSVICGTDSVQFSGTGTFRFNSRGGVQNIVRGALFTAVIQNMSVVLTHRTENFTAYYLLVTDSNSNVLEVVSTDLANPTDVAPVPISPGRFNIQAESTGSDKKR